MIAREYTDWLDIVEQLPESELPTNVSTVAYAVKVASLIRAELGVYQQVLDELLDTVSEAADRRVLIGWRCGADDHQGEPAHVLRAEACPATASCVDRPVYLDVEVPQR